MISLKKLKVMAMILPLCVLALSACSKRTLTIDNENHLYEVLANGTDADIIKLVKKTYRLNKTLRFDKVKNLTFDGNGAVLELNSLVDDVIVINKSKNLTIKNISASHKEPEGPVGCTGNVILINDGSDITISDSELNGSGIVGVAAYKTKNLKIIDNYIHKNSSYSIIYQGDSVTIKDNKFENNGNDNNIAFSYKSSDWPPKEYFNKDVSRPGLTMEGNKFPRSKSKPKADEESKDQEKDKQ